jgi:hypothetical protein
MHGRNRDCGSADLADSRLRVDRRPNVPGTYSVAMCCFGSAFGWNAAGLLALFAPRLAALALIGLNIIGTRPTS